MKLSYDMIEVLLGREIDTFDLRSIGNARREAVDRSFRIMDYMRTLDYREQGEEVDTCIAQLAMYRDVKDQLHRLAMHVMRDKCNAE